MNPEVPGRSAITGRRGGAVWDFLSLAADTGEDTFTKYPHLTLGVTAQAVDVMVTVPHAVNSTIRRNIVDLGEDGFQKVAEKIVDNLQELLADHSGATPWSVAFSDAIRRNAQCHFSTRASNSICERRFLAAARRRHNRDGLLPRMALS
jgi:hypothetical protein